ncbi:sugar ABC transporter substrate-binding protein [Dactylosporangium sp. AC04546]|uniref:ABC transporter substrate-binding protein n=1 Tax=Dactylosporangium sp. AC04546 TaxID=2862460 RepID=UPI001EDE0DB7|nr:sugar ABC transporter substrate-binding protein [Dactylosporangium sp. AC04546]WVK79806.1 sugar ABC transporter substrate-binding protein [Dactylosporangium sp. AC04546]
MRFNRALAAPLAAAASVLMALTACSGSGQSEESDSDVHLRMVMWTSNPNQLAAFRSIADEFMQQSHSVTKIDFQSITLDQLNTVLTTQIQAGDPPDLSWLPVESSRQYIKAGALVDAAPVLKSTDGYDYDDLTPSLASRWKVGDALYGVPFSTGPLVMYYNKDLYAKAGVKSPADLIAEKNWTWESFRQSSKALTDKLGLPGYVLNDFDFKNWTRLLPLLYSYGASAWNDDATKCTADSPEFLRAISLFHDMVFTDKSSPVPGQQADFWGGQAGATTAFLGSSSLLKDATFKFGMVPTPSGPAGDTQALGQSSIVTLAASKHKQAALQFLAFLTNKQNSAKLAQFYPPIRSSLLNPKTIVGSSTILTEDLVAPIVAAAKTTGKIFPSATDATGVADALNSSLDKNVYVPNADLPDALKKVCAAVSPHL